MRCLADFKNDRLFDELVEFVARGKIGVDYLEKKNLEDAIQLYTADKYVLASVRNVSRNCARLLTISEAQIKGFFGTIATIRNPRQLFTLPIVLEKLQRLISPNEAQNVPVQVETLLDKSMLSRIQEFSSQAEVMSDSMTAPSFLKLLELVNQDLELIAKDYDLLLLGSIYVSRVCAHAFIRYLTPLLSDFATFYSRGSIEMAEGFEIYNASLKFERICVNIDSGMKSFFSLSDWFRPVIKDWFKVSGTVLFPLFIYIHLINHE
jgi:hypothetical protein